MSRPCIFLVCPHSGNTTAYVFPQGSENGRDEIYEAYSDKHIRCYKGTHEEEGFKIACDCRNDTHNCPQINLCHAYKVGRAK